MVFEATQGKLLISTSPLQPQQQTTFQEQLEWLSQVWLKRTTLYDVRAAARHARQWATDLHSSEEQASELRRAAHVLEGYADWRAGQFTEALKLLEEVTEQTRGYPDIWCARAMNLLLNLETAIRG